MTMESIKKLTAEEITKKIEEIKKELFNLKFTSATGTLEKPHRIKNLRHDVARLKTELNARKKESVK